MHNVKLELPIGFYEAEIRNDYLISSEMKKVWAVLFDLLNVFQRVCAKHNIKWWGDAGTILGAARHKGMIPWDDDIDVMLMRDDYNKLCEIAPKEFSHPYFFQTEQTDKGSCRGHAQLRNSETTGILKGEVKRKLQFNQGIFLDIFPIETIPNDETLFQKQAANVAMLKGRAVGMRNRTTTYHFVFRKNVVLLMRDYLFHVIFSGKLRRFYRYEEVFSQFEEEMQKYSGTESERVCKLCLPPVKPRRIWKRSWFDDTVYLPFEMFQLPVPVGYKELLDTFYGDWHTFKIGASTHGGCVFDTDKPYTEYIRK